MRFDLTLLEIDLILKHVTKELYFFNEAKRLAEESGKSMDGNKKTEDYKYVLSQIDDLTKLKNKLEVIK